MVLELREREHEALDTEIIKSDQAQEALHQFGLNKFFEMNGMHVPPWMLEMLVAY